VTDADSERARRRIVQPEDSIPRHPYLGSAIVYAILAIVVVIVAWATAGELGRAVIFGGGFFVVATVWSWWRFRRRIQAAALAARRVEAQQGRSGQQ
jgi:hypothetical protein